MVVGAVGVLAIPVGVAVSWYDDRVSLLDAAWAVPVAAFASTAALLLVRGLRGHVRTSVTPSRSVRVARSLGVAGICLTLAAAIAVGFFELLVRLEG